MSQNQALLYMRYVLWEIVVPLGLEWDFMKAFGEAFREKDTIGPRDIRPVDSYFEHPGGWHIKVSIHESTEPELEEFCQAFFSSRGLEFRGPENVTAGPSTEVVPSEELLTPAGRKFMCERLSCIRTSASESAEQDGRRQWQPVKYTTDGKTVFSNGNAMTDQEVFTHLVQMSSVCLGLPSFSFLGD